MATVRDLRNRIRSLKNTQQITKAMKQVAAAKIRRAQNVQRQAKPYADAIAAMLADLTSAGASIDHPFLKAGKEGAPAGVILMTADKGLAGAFNSNIIRSADVYRREHSVTFYTVGIKARNAVRRFGIAQTPNWILNTPSKLQTAREVAQRVTADFDAAQISNIVLISSRLVSMMLQRPQVRTLVPVEPPQREQADNKPKGAVEFAPSPEFVLAKLLPKYLEFSIFSAMLETDAAFFAAQLLAMTNATDNAGKLIDELTIAMNNARQAAITKELLEVVSGAEALTA